MHRYWYFAATILLASAGVSDYCLYDDWHTHDHRVDTSWKWLYVNSVLLSVVALGMTVWLGFKKCCSPFRFLSNCLLTITCLKPLFEVIFFASLAGYLAICVFLLRHISGERAQVEALKDDHRNLFVAYITQLVGCGLLLLATAVYFLTSPCRACGSKKKTKRRRASDSDSMGDTLI